MSTLLHIILIHSLTSPDCTALLNFFKINDPYRLAFVFLLMLLIRVPLIYSGIPLIAPELKWMIIGEALANGKDMYKDIWDFTGPLSAGIYGLVHLLFGKSVMAYRALSMVLVLIQCGVFNNLLLKNKAYNQNTYIPALMYMLFMHVSFDFLTLSPVLMGMTLVLLAVNNLFQRMDNLTRDDLFVQMGLYLGLATLFYLPFLLYFVVIIASLLIYTGSVIRRMSLMVYGFFLVLVIASFYYFWFDSFAMFRVAYFESIFSIKPQLYITRIEFLGLVFIPLSIFVVSFVKSRSIGRYINFQIKIQNVMLMFMFAGIFSVLLSREFSVYQLIFVVPGLAFFTSHYLIALKNWIMAEAVFVIIALLLLLNMLFPLKRWLFVDEFISFDQLMVQETPYDTLTEGKKLLVIGESIDAYSNSSLATPYLNWQLTRNHFQNLGYYDNLSETYLHFTDNPPDVIIDEKKVVPELFKKVPTVGLKYTPHYSIENVYLRKGD